MDLRKTFILVIIFVIFGSAVIFRSQKLTTSTRIETFARSDKENDHESVKANDRHHPVKQKRLQYKSKIRAKRVKKISRYSQSDFLGQKTVEQVKKYVMFVGYSRSGTTFTSILMDAHPNMIISHELEYLTLWWQDPNSREIDKYSLFNMIYATSHRKANVGRSDQDYTLRTNSSWRGRFDTLQVIGNKKANHIGRVFGGDPQVAREKYAGFIESIKLPVYFINLVRNPYDMIATKLIHSRRHGIHPHTLLGKNVTQFHMNDTLIIEVLRDIIKHSKTVIQMKNDYGYNILQLHLEDFIEQTRHAIGNICEYLELHCSEDYFKICEEAAFDSISRTRDLMEWSPQVVKRVREEIDKIPFFRGYTFQEDSYAHT